MNAPQRHLPHAAATPHYGRWLEAVASEPYRFDFYRTLRQIEAIHPQLPRLGEAVRPADEPVRIAQPPELTFAPASLHSVEFAPDGRPRLMQRIFGLIGPQGPLPIHMTELARERVQHQGDAGLQRFLDTLMNRFGLLFYRAWSQAQPSLSLDRAGDHGFERRLGSLAGLGPEPLLARDAAGDHAKLHFTGRLARHVRDADGLLAWCKSEFDAPVRIEQWTGHWMPLDRAERTRLHHRHNKDVAQSLGRGAVLGGSCWDVQHKFRIVIGPVSEARYHAFLPGGADLARLQAIVRQWVGLEFEWDVQLILAQREVPRQRLGRNGELGRSCWLGAYRRGRDADDLVIDVERTLRPRRARKDGQKSSNLGLEP